MAVYQEMVFFPEYPTLDPQRLWEDLFKCDPEEGRVPEVSAFEEREDLPEELAPLRATYPDIRLKEGSVAFGDIQVEIRIFNVPAPHTDCLRASMLAPEEKEQLESHKSFALLSITEDTKRLPIERLIVLLKIGVALCHQGALGIGNEINLTAFTRETLLSLVEESLEEDYSLFSSLRDEGSPVELLVNSFLTTHHNEHWCFSAGHELFGLPDFACPVTQASDIEKVQEAFFGGFQFMFEHGAPIEPGETFSDEDGLQFRFVQPAPDQEFLQQDNGVLVLTWLKEA